MFHISNPDKMDSFDLDLPIIELANANEKNFWTIRHAVEGVQIFGGIGSGKTSGSGRMLALKYLSKGFGGLVLTVKPDEKKAWQEYCQITNRQNDLLILEPGGKLAFNFLQYESSQSNSTGSITDNIVEVLKTVIRAGAEKGSGKSDDPFWETALDMLIFNVIDLCRLAYGRISVQEIYDIVQTIPKAKENIGEKAEDGTTKPFDKAFETARDNVTSQVDQWFENLPEDERDRLLKSNNLDTEIVYSIPDARLFNILNQFFFENFITLSEKTRSIIDFTFSGFLFRLLRDPVYSLFCKNTSTVTPEDSLKGKIIIINLPVKLYHKVGRDCQILFKYIWQRAMEKRHVTEKSRPLFLWADEAQHFLHEHDADYQATARSSRISTVYISQNLPNYYASMGGQQSEQKVKSFLGTLGTKIFHANADIETNKYASELIGDAYFEDHSDSVTYAKNFSQSKSTSLRLERVVRPEEFTRLKTGGPPYNNRVEGYFLRQGNMLVNNMCHLKMSFNQSYLPLL